MNLFKNTRAIAVRDVKQHLIDEFKRSNALAETIKEKDKQLELAEKTKEDLDKACIVLEQYKFRHGKQQEEIDELKEKIKILKEKIKNQKEETNDAIIKMMNAEKEKNRVVKEFNTYKREVNNSKRKTNKRGGKNAK